MESKSSLPYLQEPATDPYSESRDSCPQPHIQFQQDPFSCFPSIYV
jgi:hypothetical protein